MKEIDRGGRSLGEETRRRDWDSRDKREVESLVGGEGKEI
jgi:hypothetical protein